MKNNVQLLEQYKEEKALVIGSLQERTGLEEFPTFAEWKEEYVTAYMETHLEVPVEEADALFDKVVEEAEEELEGSQDRPTIQKPAKPGKVPVETIKKAVKKVKAERAAKKTRTPRANSKTATAQKIFDKMYPKKKRAEIIAAFMESGLTKNGASTYYQRMKKVADGK